MWAKDADAVVKALVALGIVVVTSGDVVSLRRAIAFGLENLTRQVRKEHS